jgi:small subunit ribosomal protein S2
MEPLTQSTKENINLSVKDLLEAGAHFGHQKHRWNPKMRRFIFEERNGIYIIDLAKTMQQIRKAVAFVKEVATKHRPILFVGTKKQAKDVIKECAEECGEFYVCERWLGGMLTNLTTIRKSIKTLEKTEKKIAQGREGVTKKELSELTKKQQKLDKNLSGIRSMRKIPSLLVVVDPGKEKIAVQEARKLGIPVMALVDTNCNPDPIDYIIACNDDALKSIKLILTAIKDAILEKKSDLNIAVSKGDVEPSLEKNERSSEENGGDHE